MDGMLHGVVAWGLTTLVLAYLATTAAAAVIGGTMGIIGQTVQTSAQAAAGGGNQLEQMVTGTQGEANVTPQTLAALRDRLVAGDREGAVQVMTDEMGFGQDRAEQIVDGAMPLFAQDGQQVEQAAGQAVGTLTAVSWWLFATLLVSLGLAVWGGAMGARGTGKRAWGDHSDERHYIEA